MKPTPLTYTVLISATALSVMVFASARAADLQSPAELVQACKAEAVQGHSRYLHRQRQAIDAHKRRMIEHCEGSRRIGEGDREKFLRSCRKEAAWGARSYDRRHMLRQQRLCEKLIGQP